MSRHSSQLYGGRFFASFGTFQTRRCSQRCSQQSSASRLLGHVQPGDSIPHPATWLNGERWLDEDTARSSRESQASAVRLAKSCRCSRLTTQRPHPQRPIPRLRRRGAEGCGRSGRDANTPPPRSCGGWRHRSSGDRGRVVDPWHLTLPGRRTLSVANRGPRNTAGARAVGSQWSGPWCSPDEFHGRVR